MDKSDATPSRDDDVVLSKQLRGFLRQVAERRLRDACDLAFPPDRYDEVIEAVHVLDAFNEDRVTAGVVLALIPAAIAFQKAEAERQDGAEANPAFQRARGAVRELMSLRDALAGDRPEDSR